MTCAVRAPEQPTPFFFVSVGVLSLDWMTQGCSVCLSSVAIVVLWLTVTLLDLCVPVSHASESVSRNTHLSSPLCKAEGAERLPYLSRLWCDVADQEHLAVTAQGILEHGREL
jgi:hypothetical protein